MTSGPTLEAILGQATQFRPDVILLDEHLAGMGDGHELIADFDGLGARVVMVTAITDRAVLGTCVEEGAVGIVSKAAPMEAVIAATAAAATTGRAMPEHQRQELLADLRAARSERAARLAPFAALTPREQDVLIALGDGLTAAEIAEELYVSLWTVRGHIKSILAKLGVTSQLRAVAKARHAGWM
jgi:DNA-binding NarL/FixJ family response regulator